MHLTAVVGEDVQKRGLLRESIPVQVAADRRGATASKVLEMTEAKHIKTALKPLVAVDTVRVSYLHRNAPGS